MFYFYDWHIFNLELECMSWSALDFFIHRMQLSNYTFMIISSFCNFLILEMPATIFFLSTRHIYFLKNCQNGLSNATFNLAFLVIVAAKINWFLIGQYTAWINILYFFQVAIFQTFFMSLICVILFMYFLFKHMLFSMLLWWFLNPKGRWNGSSQGALHTHFPFPQ